MGSNLLGHTSRAQPTHPDCWVGIPCRCRVHTQCHSAFRLVRSSQVASCMHHPDTPLPLRQSSGPSPTLETWTPPNPPVDRPSPSPARPRPTNTRSVPSSFRLSPSLTSTTTCHLQSLPNHSEPYLPYLATFPIPPTSNTHHSYQQPLSSSHLRARTKSHSK